jgi:hypothetical protein
MSNKAVILDVEIGKKYKYIMNYYRTIIKELKDKHTYGDILDGIHDYYKEMMYRKGPISRHLDFDSIEKNVFVLPIDNRGLDRIVVLETSKYYNWLSMFIVKENVTYVDEQVINHIKDIILDNPNKELIAYKLNGERQIVNFTRSNNNE